MTSRGKEGIRERDRKVREVVGEESQTTLYNAVSKLRSTLLPPSL